MIYYPVCIPTLNRYTHFKRCVESLAENTHADKTELLIGLDYPPKEKYVEGYLKIKEYIPTINSFGKITVFDRDRNYGPIRNLHSLLEYAFTHYDAAILTEDDNEFSPCFLDFMNKVLQAYKDDKKIISVSGFLGKRYYEKTDKNLLLNYDNCAWGIGIWKAKWCMRQSYTPQDYQDIILSYKQSFKIFKTSPGILSMFIGMVQNSELWGDVAESVLNIINNTYQLRPSFSLVRNCGFDGTGVHCGSGDPDDLAHQMISEESLFENDIHNVENISASFIRKQLFLHMLPKGFFKKTKFFINLFLRFFKLRYTLVNK